MLPTWDIKWSHSTFLSSEACGKLESRSTELGRRRRRRDWREAPWKSCLKNLKELNVSFNHLKSIPPELGECENLEKLDCSGNLELTELPFELSNLKQVTFVDLSANKFSSVPICVLRMSSLQWLDISNNSLSDLPQDIDR
nr:leucine rich repeat containing 2 [Myotis myotis]